MGASQIGVVCAMDVDGLELVSYKRAVPAVFAPFSSRSFYLHRGDGESSSRPLCLDGCPRLGMGTVRLSLPDTDPVLYAREKTRSTMYAVVRHTRPVECPGMPHRAPKPYLRAMRPLL